jgi:hypothetical protein
VQSTGRSLSATRRKGDAVLQTVADCGNEQKPL